MQTAFSFAHRPFFVVCNLLIKIRKKGWGGLGRLLGFRREVMLKRGGGGQLPPFHLSSPMFSLITNVNGDNKATFAYHNPPISRPPGLGALGSAALHSLSKKVKKKRERERRSKRGEEQTWSTLRAV